MFRLSFIIIALSVLVSCHKGDDNQNIQPNEPEADYTVMLYGSAGMTLDDYLDFNLEQIENFGYSEKIQFTGLFKYSACYQGEAEREGTRKFTMTKDGMQNERVYDANFALSDPQNLANFIAEAKKEFPAKNYILIFWNHGNTFDIYDQPVASHYPTESRSLLNDDCTFKTLSIFEIEEAFKREGKGVDMVYWDICYTNTIENNYQIKDYTRYILGSPHETADIGGNYTQLFMSLDSHQTLEGAMKDYVSKIKSYWDNSTTIIEPHSLTFNDSQFLDDVVAETNECCNIFFEVYKHMLAKTSAAKAYINKATQSGEFDRAKLEEARADIAKNIHFQMKNGTQRDGINYPTNDGFLYYFGEEISSVDLCSAFSYLSTYLMNGELVAARTRLANAIDNMVVADTYSDLPETLERASIGITWIDSDEFNLDLSDYHHYITDFEGNLVDMYEDLEYTILRDVYKMTAFDKATGWSDFLTINDMSRYELRKNTPTEESYCIDPISGQYIIYLGDYTYDGNYIGCEKLEESLVSYMIKAERLLE